MPEIMPSYAKFNIKVMPKTSDWNLGFQMRTPTGENWPFTNKKFAIQIRDKQGRLMLTMNEDNGRIIADAGTSMIYVNVDDEDTDFPIGIYNYDLRITDTAIEKSWKYLGGTWEVIPFETDSTAIV